MAANLGLRLSYSECLREIEQFGMKVAQDVEGGEVTAPNHRSGDLFHLDRGLFSEVKASGISAGPIITEDQLIRHYEECGEYDCQYIFVMYEGREWSRGKYHYLPVKMGKRGQKVLRRFLVKKLTQVYVVHVSVIWSIYETHRRRGSIQEYEMQRGTKRYIKITSADLKRISTEKRTLADFGLKHSEYEVTKELKLARYGGFKSAVPVTRILRSVSFEADVSFDVAAIEKTG